MPLTFNGTGVALVTPFKSDLSVDYDSLADIIENLIKNDVDFLVALGTTAETPTLTKTERHELTRFITTRVAGRIPVMLGAGGNNTAELVDYIHSLDFKGIDGLLSVTPYYNKPKQSGLVRHFTTVADVSPVPVCLYNVPGRTGVNMTAETTLALSRHMNINAVKEASGNMAQITEIIRQKDPGFTVLSGDDALTYPLMTMGAHGVISVVANAFPARFSKMVKALQAGRFNEALPLHYSLVHFTNLVFAEGSPAGIKAALEVLGLCRNYLRLPLDPVSESLYGKIATAVKELKS